MVAATGPLSLRPRAQPQTPARAELCAELRPKPARGFTLVECLLVCAVVALLAVLVIPLLRGTELRAGRWDAVDALTRLQGAQERYRANNGFYAADITGLPGASPFSSQGRYLLSLTRQGGEAYTATAVATGRQRHDSACARLTLSVDSGFPSEGPSASCWNR